MKVQSSENKLVITEEFIFDQNKLPSDPNNHFKPIPVLANAQDPLLTRKSLLEIGRTLV